MFSIKNISIYKYNVNSKYYSDKRMIKEKHLQAKRVKSLIGRNQEGLE